MTLRDVRISFTSDSSGDVVAYGEPVQFARLIAVMFDRGDVDAGADFILTTDRYDVVEAILTITAVGSADKIWYPRRLLQGETGSNLTGTHGGDREPFLMIGRPKLTIDDGGNKASGAVILILEE